MITQHASEGQYLLSVRRASHNSEMHNVQQLSYADQRVWQDHIVTTIPCYLPQVLALYGVCFNKLHTVLKRVRWDLIEGTTLGKAQINMGRRQRINMKPGEQPPSGRCQGMEVLSARYTLTLVTNQTKALCDQQSIKSNGLNTKLNDLLFSAENSWDIHAIR